MKTVPYFGGKSPVRKAARWIAPQIPWDYKSHYCEPFAGMLGVLLSRQRVAVETVNDLNGRIVNWWRVIRDCPEEFGRYMDWTPQASREEFEDCKLKLDSEDPIEKAAAFAVVTRHSLRHADEPAASFVTNVAPGHPNSAVWSTDVAKLHHRLRNVQLESVDAVHVIERLAREPLAVLYVDPPYRSGETSPYQCAMPDWTRLEVALKDCKGKVAVSGYNDEWNCLGWRSESLESLNHFNPATRGKDESARVEKLWMNYDPVAPGLFN